jgi:hypothetical protein
MADEEEILKSCEMCGATVYPEHIESNIAGEWEGQLYCRHCLQEKKSEAGLLESKEDSPISLSDVDLDAPAVSESSKIRQFGSSVGGMSDSLAGAVVEKTDWHRDVLQGSPNATRCRTFHCKLTDASLAHMNQQINEWVDHHEEIEIKFATSTIGVVEGKHADPHLILTVFY